MVRVCVYGLLRALLRNNNRRSCNSISPYHLIHSSVHTHTHARTAAELYTHVGDDSHEMDNFENANVAKSQPDLAKSMHAELLSFFQVHEEATREGRRARVGAEIKTIPDDSDEFDN